VAWRDQPVPSFAAMRIRPFGVEQWMSEYETRCGWNLAETCVESLTVGELLDMAGLAGSILDELLPMKLTYGPIEGSGRLRGNVAGLYADQSSENVLITHGASGANQLAYLTLVEAGDRVVSVLPTYQQHYSIPESIGADVRILRLREDNAFLPDLDELRQLAGAATKLIAINNPNNPTGALMDQALLGQIADIADACGAYLLCDEVYRGTDQDGTGTTASVVDVYARGISTGSMSKAFSLAGLRLGWITAPTDLIDAIAIHRDYNTISVSMLDDLFASIALEHKDQILQRSRAIVRHNLAILDAWVANEPRITYVKPRSGTTALLSYDLDLPSRDLCVRLVEDTGVMLTPGSTLDTEGHLRIGYANRADTLHEGLRRLSHFLRSAL
jgi:aspartate/methionine/tyrosine aminotransferase